jgi:hypothetical protein
MLRLLGPALVAAAVLAGCASRPAEPPAAPPASTPAPRASGPGPSAARYRCEQGLEFSVRFADDTAVIEERARAGEVLLRDAGGVTPQQTVYSNQRLRAEFGLGATGREARLNYLPEQRMAHCQRD